MEAQLLRVPKSVPSPGMPKEPRALLGPLPTLPCLSHLSTEGLLEVLWTEDGPALVEQIRPDGAINNSVAGRTD